MAHIGSQYLIGIFLTARKDETIIKTDRKSNGPFTYPWMPRQWQAHAKRTEQLAALATAHEACTTEIAAQETSVNSRQLTQSKLKSMQPLKRHKRTARTQVFILSS